MPAVLVIGAGVGGIKASLSLAEAGFKVYLSESLPNLGGTLSQLDKWFPDNHCGMCQILPIFARDNSSQYCLRRGLFHPNIELLPLTEVDRLEGEAGDFTVALRVKPRRVKPELCIRCGVCSQVCPVEVDSEFNQGMGKRKAIYIQHPLVPFNTYIVDQDNCTQCEACVQSCPTGAIDLHQAERTTEVKAGAIILATGFEEFNPRPSTQYGYKRYPNVVTSIELERILSPTGPSQGKLARPSDGEIPHSIAFLQCVGSRDADRGYCSSACCMIAIKEAMLVKEASPKTDAHIFFMDMRTFGKGYYRYYEQAKHKGVKFIRCRIPVVKQDPQTKNLLVTVQGDSGELEKREYGLLVLSVGQTPSPRFKEICRTLGVELNKWGFCKTSEFSSVGTSRNGIYVCGTASRPKDIADTLVDAGAAACQASLSLLAGGAKPVQVKSYHKMADLGEEPQIAVFICRCGEEVSKVVNVEKLAQFAKGLPGVTHSEEISYLCQNGALEAVKRKIMEGEANRVVLMACSPVAYGRLFTETAQQVGLNSSLLQLVSLREEVAWVHQNDPEAATEKGKSLLAMALERARVQDPLPLSPSPLEAKAVVIGGGLAGLIAAEAVAEHGIEVHLIEKSDELGGNLKDIYSTIEGSDPQILLRDIITKAESNPLIHLYKQTEVVQAGGYAGDFELTLRDKDEKFCPIKVGAIIIATGAEESHPTEYLYDQSQSIVTQKELELQLASGSLSPKYLRSVVMIQCVGSRDGQRPYCSRICCSQALKNALNLKEQNPETEVFILYRDVMSYEFREEYYTQARERGVVFIRYELDNKPQVRMEEERLEVRVLEPMLGEGLVLEPDLVVLSPAIVPRDNNNLAQLLGVELTEDGFFQEAEAKFRPVDLLTDGIFVCGLAHSPKTIGETIAQAQAAAQRAVSILTREQLQSGRIVSEVNERRCTGCEVCVQVCPYNARAKDVEKGVVVVREALCQGCGACAAACPNDAAKLRAFTDRQAFSMIDTAF